VTFEPKLAKQAEVLDYPSRPQVGYSTEPPFDEILKMDKAALQSVNYFKIYNNHGSIEFFGPCDLTGVDLGKVTIDKGAAEIY